MLENILIFIDIEHSCTQSASHRSTARFRVVPKYPQGKPGCPIPSRAPAPVSNDTYANDRAAQAALLILQESCRRFSTLLHRAKLKMPGRFRRTFSFFAEVCRKFAKIFKCFVKFVDVRTGFDEIFSEFHEHFNSLLCSVPTFQFSHQCFRTRSSNDISRNFVSSYDF